LDDGAGAGITVGTAGKALEVYVSTVLWRVKIIPHQGEETHVVGVRQSGVAQAEVEILSLKEDSTVGAYGYGVGLSLVEGEGKSKVVIRSSRSTNRRPRPRAFQWRRCL